MTLNEILDRLGITENRLMDTYTVKHIKPREDGRMETVIRKGDTYEQLTVYGMLRLRHKSDNKVYPYVICRCNCGNYTLVMLHNLIKINSNTKSCGCLNGECNESHGMTGTRLYSEWAHMKKRCSYTHKRHEDYYDRGIRVCREWENSFTAFKEWALANGYNDNLIKSYFHTFFCLEYKER